MALYGIGLDVNLKRINLDFRLYIANKHGGLSVRNLEKIFNQFDTNGNGSLDIEEFTKALNGFGFFMKKTDYQILHKFYDTNSDGSISFKEFIAGLREPLPEKRYNLIGKLFQQIDSEGQGFINYDQFAKAFRAGNYSQVQRKQLTEDQYSQQVFSEIDNDNNGIINQDEWVQFFTDQSLCFPSDQQFIDYLKTNWGFSDSASLEVTQNAVRHIVKALRFKLIQSTSGTHEEFLLRKLFNEFDTNKSGTLTIDELYAMTIKLEVPIEKQYLQAVFNKFDSNNSGKIDFNEFVAFIVNDPYQ